MAVGRDAADVAITTSFGAPHLTRFYVESTETDTEGNRVLPTSSEQQETLAFPEPTQLNTHPNQQ